MKKTLLSLSLVLLVSSTFAQTIRRVNTNPAVTGLNVYPTLQAAHNAATAGDIIIVEASSISAGNLIATKGLKIYGKGYFTGANSELHVSPDPSLVGDVTFDGVAAGNSEMSGITCNQLNIKGASNIRIFRNRVLGTFLVDAQSIAGTDINVSNIQIAQNYLEGNLNLYSTTTGLSTVSVTNNFIYLIQTSTGNISGLIINNNVIDYYVIIHNATFQNNLLAGSNNFSEFTGCIVTNNATNGTENDVDFTGGVGNQNTFDLNSTTEGFMVSTTIADNALPAGTSIDERWMLQPTSSLKTAGTSGSELGMYGGLNPYIPSGIPPAPSIIKLLTPDYGNTAAPLTVTISVKSNN